MDILQTVEKWIAWYAVKYKYSSVLHRLSNASEAPLNEGLPPCLLEAYALCQMINDRDIDSYDMGMSIVISLYKLVTHCIRPSFLVKILDAFKVVILFDMLRTKHADMGELLARLNQFFPRVSVTPANSDLPEAVLTKMAKYRAGYRSFFLSLLANPDYCARYLKKQYDGEFGCKFEARLSELVLRVVAAVDARIPISPIQKILESGPSSEFVRRLGEFHQPAIELVMDMCSDKDILTEQDCSQLIDKLRPSGSVKHLSVPPLTLQSSYFQSQSQSQSQRQMDHGLEASPGLTTLLETTRADSPPSHHVALAVNRQVDKSQEPGTSNGIKRKGDHCNVEDSCDEVTRHVDKRRRMEVKRTLSNDYSSAPNDSYPSEGSPGESQSFSFPKGQVYRMKSTRTRTSLSSPLSKQGHNSTPSSSPTRVSNKSIRPEKPELDENQVYYEVISHQEMENENEASQPKQPSQSEKGYPSAVVREGSHQSPIVLSDSGESPAAMSNSRQSPTVLAEAHQSPAVRATGQDTQSEYPEAKTKPNQRKADRDHLTNTPEQVDLVSSSSQGSSSSSIHPITHSKQVNRSASTLHPARCITRATDRDTVRLRRNVRQRKSRRLRQINTPVVQLEGRKRARIIEKLPDVPDEPDEMEISIGSESLHSSIIEVVSAAGQGSSSCRVEERNLSLESSLSFLSSSVVAEDADPIIVPISHSCDKFDAMVEKHAVLARKTLPPLQTHLHPLSVKSCIVKLHRDKTLDVISDKVKVMVYR